MADKIQNAYHDSKNIYDNVLTQVIFLVKCILSYSGAGRMTTRLPGKFFPIFQIIFLERFWMFQPVLRYSRIKNGNGFHVFPDKERAFGETWRVLKPGGKLIACFYIKGEVGITDWLVKNILSKKGWFTPPFQTRSELETVLKRMYQKIDLHTDGSMVYFECTK